MEHNRNFLVYELEPYGIAMCLDPKQSITVISMWLLLYFSYIRIISYTESSSIRQGI